MDTLATRATIFLRLKSDDTVAREVAWVDFRGRYAPIIAGFARKLGVRPQDVDDVIQDVMLAFYARSPMFVYDPSKGRFRGYLKVCTIRAVRQRVGQNAKFQAVPIDCAAADDAAADQVWNTLWAAELLNRAVSAVRKAYETTTRFRRSSVTSFAHSRPTPSPRRSA